MKVTEIIAKAKAELEWAESKLAAVGYPGVVEVEQSVKRALAHLRSEMEAEAQKVEEKVDPFYLQLVDQVKKLGPQLVTLAKDGTLSVLSPAVKPEGPDDGGKPVTQEEEPATESSDQSTTPEEEKPNKPSRNNR